jgi:hypothetical protein
VAVGGEFVLKRIVCGVSYRGDVEEESVVHLLRGDVLNRDFADETVPG